MGSESLGHVTGQTAKHLPLYTEAEEGGGMRAGGLTAAAGPQCLLCATGTSPCKHSCQEMGGCKDLMKARMYFNLLSCLHRDPTREVQYDCLQTAMQSWSLDSKLEVGLLCSMQNFLFLSTCINAGLFVCFLPYWPKGKKKKNELIKKKSVSLRLINKRPERTTLRVLTSKYCSNIELL